MSDALSGQLSFSGCTKLNSPEASVAAEIATSTFQDLGVLVATNKTEGPSTCVTFLGIEVDTCTFQLDLPDDKLHRLQLLIANGNTRGHVLAGSWKA